DGSIWNISFERVVVIGFFFIFFFQAEDGIRDRTVTGVQTCALPISTAPRVSRVPFPMLRASSQVSPAATTTSPGLKTPANGRPRSEERRVGKECRSRWARKQ